MTIEEKRKLLKHYCDTANDCKYCKIKKSVQVNLLMIFQTLQKIK